MKNLKRLACMAMSVVMTLALAVPSFADAKEKCTITIHPDQYSEENHETRFEAYQIFAGTVETDVESGGRKLSHITWGNGVNGENLIAAMKLDPKIGTDGGFSTYWADYETNRKNEYANDAVAVARFLDELFKDTKRADDTYGNGSCWDAFNALVAKHLKEECTKSTRAEHDGDWTITVDPGYYLIIDKVAQNQSQNHEVSDVASSYILEVIGTREIDVKSSVPTVEKIVEQSTVLDSAGHKGNLEATDSESHMTFTITGTLPENYKDFTKYRLRFVDTVSVGLTPEISTIKVEVKAQDGTSHPLEKSHYTVTPAAQDAWTDGTTTQLTVDIADLVAADPHIEATSTIVLTYQAHLNKFASVGKDKPNTNEVRMQYSNDPYADDEGEVKTKDTVPSETKTFTLGLDITKLDGTRASEDNLKATAGAGGLAGATPMKDVEFCLKNQEGKFAVVEPSGGPTTGANYYKLKQWKEGEQATDDCWMKTDDKGVIHLEGLKEGSYVLVERETAANLGYEKMEDIWFDLSASVVGEGGSAKLTDTHANLTSGHDKRQDVAIGDEDGNGVFEMTLLNYEAPILPHTGGMGVYVLFAIGGIILAVGAGVFCVSRRRTGR